MTEEEMLRIRDRLQAVAKSLTEAIDDAFFDFSKLRAHRRYEDACRLYKELESEMKNHPFISGDLNECALELEILRSNSPIEARIILEREFGPEHVEKARQRYQKRHDYLGRAAELKREAKLAEREKRFDDAWRAIEASKNEYLKHAEYLDWDRKDTLRLYAGAFEITANILRKEGKHVEALRHFLYFSAHSANPSASHISKLRAYLNRSNLPSTSVAAALAVIDRSKEVDGMEVIDRAIQSWRD